MVIPVLVLTTLELIVNLVILVASSKFKLSYVLIGPVSGSWRDSVRLDLFGDWIQEYVVVSKSTYI